MEFVVFRSRCGDFIDLVTGTPFRVGCSALPRKPTLEELANLPWSGRAAELNIESGGAIQRTFRHLHIDEVCRKAQR